MHQSAVAFIVSMCMRTVDETANVFAALGVVHHQSQIPRAAFMPLIRDFGGD